MPEQELAAGGLCECKQSTGMDSPEMVEILATRWETKELPRIGSHLDADEAVEWKFRDTVFHVLLDEFLATFGDVKTAIISESAKFQVQTFTRLAP